MFIRRRGARYVTVTGVVYEYVTVICLLSSCDRDENYFAGIIDCLRLEDAETLDFWSILGFLIYHQQLPPYLPVIDGDFIADVSLWSGV